MRISRGFTCLSILSPTILKVGSAGLDVGGILKVVPEELDEQGDDGVEESLEVNEKGEEATERGEAGERCAASEVEEGGEVGEAGERGEKVGVYGLISAGELVQECEQSSSTSSTLVSS